MIAGMRGSLLSHEALHGVPGRHIGEDARLAHRRVAAWYAEVQREAGPAWGARTVFDRIALPFCRAFGFDVLPIGGDPRMCRGVLRQQGATAAFVAAFAWGQEPGTGWRDSVRGGIASETRWCYSFAGQTLRIYDALRTHSRRFVEFDLPQLCQHAATFEVAWRLLTHSSGLDDAVLLSERHRAGVRDSLQVGVNDAVRHLTSAFLSASRMSRARTGGATALDESLVVIYRILFLLFAEARGLVPAWHPVFRESYTIEALRPAIETRRRPRGVWEALQAIARLAHRGCRAGTLRVPPFNGRLFSPADAPLADSVPLDDGAVRQALLAITTRKTKNGRERIAYSDLGVEQLGGVYERVLDYDLDPDGRGEPRLVKGDRRRATGSFYTPRSVTEYIVRRTLAPLVEHASPEEILSLRVLDPAMGSGAFLVAACRYLAVAYEASLLREGGLTSEDISDADRSGFRRTVAQRCLYGVDMNPMAVQLARLSLWLATLSHDRPLTFFDHHLRTGNSLVGASIAEVRRRLPGRRLATSTLPLLDEDAVSAAMGGAVATRERLRIGLEETLEQVRRKERIVAEMESDGAPLARWKAIADLWCAGWFDASARGLNRATLEALIDHASGRYVLSEAVANEVLERGRETARAQRFFHWELEFPEAFYADAGEPLADPGFDAIVGNPPWEMVRGDTGDGTARAEAARAGSALTRFVRDSGIYHAQGDGHANLYQMFLERALALIRRGGRLGFIVPSGFALDHGCAALRRHVLRSSNVDSFVVVENREGLFPIHRGLKFVLMTLTKAGGTTVIPLRCGLRSAVDFDRLPDTGADPDGVPVSCALIARLSDDQLAIPELRTPMDARIISDIAFRFPAAGSAEGWGLRFGRELNATDDRRHFNTTGRGLPVLEGKHVRPFTVDVASARHHLDPVVAGRLLARRPFERTRLAYRDVASSTNRLTLIAAVLPAGTVTTHTLFVQKTALDEEAQQFVAGMLNSFVANYIVRLRVTTHVTVSIVERLPLPTPSRGSKDFAVVSVCARALACAPSDVDAYAKLQAAAARLYGLDVGSFAHVLSTFPLIETALRTASLSAFTRTI